MMRLKDKVAIVTGGGHGIGRAITAAFAAEGAAVMVAGRDITRLEQTVRELGAAGGRVKAVRADVAREADAKMLADATAAAFGRIDILVNNAAVTGPVAPVSEMDFPGWNETLAINLTGTMLCAREALRYMIPRKSGVIINMSSEGGRGCDGRAGYPNRAAYCSSKIAIIGLTETMAVEVGQHAIRVNAISPAGVMGEHIKDIMSHRAATMGITMEELIGRHVSNYSLGRMAEESEIAAIAVFLASDESSAITGQTIVANCGHHIVH
jgi:NAD(P)-dependent dehydrogenase (short-subunit alcohol dehydrogenase family)